MKFNDYLQEEYGPNTKLDGDQKIYEFLQEVSGMLQNNYLLAYLKKLDEKKAYPFGKKIKYLARIDDIQERLDSLAEDIGEVTYDENAE